MSEYPKIHAPFKRFTDGPDKGKLMYGNWAQPEFEYLADNKWEFTEKVDGTNIRVYYNGATVDIKGRSDNAQIPQGVSDYIRENLRPKHFESAGITEATLYGEGYGPKIQSNGGRYLSNQSFVLFDVNIDGWWLDRDNVDDVAGKLGIATVPVIGYGTLWDAIELVVHKPAVSVFPAQNGLTSRWGDFEAEGIVARPVTQLFNRKGERITTKIKGVDFR